MYTLTIGQDTVDLLLQLFDGVWISIKIKDGETIVNEHGIILMRNPVSATSFRESGSLGSPAAPEQLPKQLPSASPLFSPA
jgi:hypothetical protein